MPDDKEVKKAEKQSSAVAPKADEITAEDLEKVAGAGPQETAKELCPPTKDLP